MVYDAVGTEVGNDIHALSIKTVVINKKWENMSVLSKIEEIINGSEIVLFMKGSKQFPQCGFSGKVVHILNSLGAEYTVFDVLQDDEIRDGIKMMLKLANYTTVVC